jgi:hypothetical protein
MFSPNTIMPALLFSWLPFFQATVAFRSIHSDLNCSSACPISDEASSIAFPLCSSSTADGEFWFLRPLGHGSASSVVKAAWVPPHRRSSRCSKVLNTEASEEPLTVAIKIFDRKSDDETDEVYSQGIQAEYAAMASFHHPNVVEAITLLKENGRFLMAMEYCERALMDLLEIDSMKESEADYIWMKIVAVVRLMHSVSVGDPPA